MPAEENRCGRRNLDAPHRATNSNVNEPMPPVCVGIPKGSGVSNTTEGWRIQSSWLRKIGIQIDQGRSSYSSVCGFDNVEFCGDWIGGIPHWQGNELSATMRSKPILQLSDESPVGSETMLTFMMNYGIGIIRIMRPNHRIVNVV
jgi:hypothetical protein